MGRYIYLRWLTVCLVLSPFAFAEFQAGPDLTPINCPKTLQQWISNRKALALDLSSESMDRSAEIKNTGGVCLQSLKDHLATTALDEVKSCFSPFIDYLNHLEKQWKLQFQDKADFKEYAKLAAPFVNPPPELTDPRFQASLQENQIDAIEAEIKRLNKIRKAKSLPDILSIVFNSPTTALDKTGSRRMLFYVANSKTPPKLEQWINFTLSDFPDRTPARQFSVVATFTDENQVRRSYFADHWRNHPRDQGTGFMLSSEIARVEDVTLRRFRLPKTDPKNCILCHTSGGPRVIRPSKIEPRYQKTLDVINRQIVNTQVSFPREVENLPSGGRMPTDPAVLPDSFIERCAKLNFYSESFQKSKVEEIRAKMNCTSCHDGNTRGILPVALPVDDHPLILDGHMPPAKDKLPPEYRRGLIDCLNKYFSYGTSEPGLLYYQLTSGTCDGLDSGLRPHSKSNESHSTHSSTPLSPAASPP